MKPLLLILIILSFSRCNNRNPDGYIIKGLTSNLPDSTMIFIAKDNEDFDSTWIINNQFTLEGKVEGDYDNMWIHNRDFSQYKSLWVVNGEMIFDASGSSSFRNAKVSGSRLQDQSNSYEEIVAPFREQMDSLSQIARKTKSDSAKTALRKEFEKTAAKEVQAGITFIEAHPEYELSAFFLTFVKNEIDKKVTKELYESLSDKAKATEWGKAISIFIEKSVKLDVGDEAIDFTLPNLNGQRVSLSDFKGKYVLLEFWATGCGPCRWENPNLRKAHSKFKNEGFEILGVCLDEKKSHWESTVKKDSISWTTVSDLKGNNGEVPLTYSVHYIPHNLLLDENGVVIAKDLRGSALQKELNKIFGG